MSWDLPAPFIITAAVSDKDIDGLQHTNNTVYVKWCERVAWAHSVSLGLDLEHYQRLDRAMVITRSEFDYLQASRLGDSVEIGTWITQCDRRLTMERKFQIIRIGDGATLLRARMDFACIALSSGKPRRLPAEFLSGYGEALVQQES